MGLRDALFGKQKLAGPARERLFALSTAAVTLDTELGLRPAGAGGVVFKPLSSGDFVRAENDLQQLLDGVAAESGSKLERREDAFGYTWIIVRDSDLEDQVTGVHAVAQGLEEAGFGGQLLAAVFKFEGGKEPVYWVYGYKRGAFWPFVPVGEGKERVGRAESAGHSERHEGDQRGAIVRQGIAGEATFHLDRETHTADGSRARLLEPRTRTTNYDFGGE